MASTVSPKLSYSICYGLMGGHLHGRKLNRLMRQNGFAYKPLTEADIIIAHSAGCWLIPENSRPKLIMYVGMPLNNQNPRQTLKAAKIMMVKNYSTWSNLRREAKSVYYGLTQPWRTLGIVRRAKKASSVILPDVPAIFIFNKDDPWPASDSLNDLTKTLPWTFINLSGAHDDIGEHPELYVEIINQYARLLP